MDWQKLYMLYYLISLYGEFTKFWYLNFLSILSVPILDMDTWTLQSKWIDIFISHVKFFTNSFVKHKRSAHVLDICACLKNIDKIDVMKREGDHNCS